MGLETTRPGAQILFPGGRCRHPELDESGELRGRSGEYVKNEVSSIARKTLFRCTSSLKSRIKTGRKAGQKHLACLGLPKESRGRGEERGSWTRLLVCGTVRLAVRGIMKPARGRTWRPCSRSLNVPLFIMGLQE